MEKDRKNNNGASLQNDRSNLEGRLRLEDFKGDKNEYISLLEASRYTPYSQEYLSLRARQGKLKAEKIGRDWMTKINWVKEYLKHINGNNENGAAKAEKIKIIFPYQAVLKYSILALVVFSVGIFTALNWQAYQPKIKNNILTISSQTKKDFKNLTRIFKTDYSYKTKKIVRSFKNINYQVAGSSTKILSVFKNTITSTIYSFETSLIKIKQTSVLTLGSINSSINNFSKSFKAADKEVSQFTIAWKNNISDFFAQTKKDTAQSTRSLVFSTGKSLTLASETILWPGKQLGKILILTSGSLTTTDDKIHHFVLAQKNNISDFFAQTKKDTAQLTHVLVFSTGKSLTSVSDTILWPGKQLGKTLITTSKILKTTDDKFSYFVLMQKKNVANFFAQTKKDTAQSTRSLVFSTGKSLTSVSDTILWPGKQLGETLVLASRISQQLAKFKSATTEQKIESPKETEIVKTENTQNAPRASGGIKLTKVKNQLTQGRLALQNYSVNLWMGLQEFFSDTKKSAIRSTQNFAQTKKSAAKSADDVFVFTGKSLTLASETILLPGKQLGKTLISTSKALKTTDDKFGYFVLAQKKNITNFFSQTKKDTAQSTRSLVFSMGKSLTLASETILWPGKQLGKTLIFASNSINTMDDKASQFTFTQKENVSDFFVQVKKSTVQKIQNLAQIKKNAAQSMDNAFISSSKNLAQIKKNAIQSTRSLVFSAGKSLTSVSETILWPGKQLGETLAFASKISQQLAKFKSATTEQKIKSPKETEIVKTENIQKAPRASRGIKLTKVKNQLTQGRLALQNYSVNLWTGLQEFFSDTKKSAIRSTQNFAQTKKNVTQSADDVFVFTGKNLTLASNTILWPGKQLGKTLISTSKTLKTTDDKISQFAFTQKENVSGFFVQAKNSIALKVQNLAQAKKNAAQSLDNTFAFTSKNLTKAKKNAIQSTQSIVFSTGKNLTLASETILWPGKQLGKTLIFTSDLIKTTKEEVGQFAIARKKNISDFSIQTKKSAIYTTQSFVQGLGIVKKSANQKYVHAQGFIREGWLAVQKFTIRNIDKIESSTSKGWNKLSNKLGDGYLALLDYLIPEREFFSQEKLACKEEAKDVETGAVVLPASDAGKISKNKHLLQEMEELFSDEVTIEKTKDGKVGIITPVKPAIPEEKYMYMLVPIEKK